ncbi:MAG: cyclic nucleotide-binding domain-containing protein, partial [Chloroflexota bacterium]
LGNLSLPESTHALVDGLDDADALVRAACLRALNQSQAASALLDIAATLSDPEPDVRFEAVSALSALAGYPYGLMLYLAPLLDDKSTKVSTRAAACLLRINPEHDKAKKHLRHTAIFGDVEARQHAIIALGDWGDVEAFEFLANELKDRTILPAVQRIILVSLTRIDALRSMPYLVDSLRSEPLVLESTVGLLAGIGAPALEPVLAALRDDDKVDGALLALERLPVPPAGTLLDFARMAVSRAAEYDGLMRGVQLAAGNARAELGRSDAMSLLAESLRSKSNAHGIRALHAIGLLGDRNAMNTAVEHLQTRDMSQRANVIEALESISAKWRDVLQPLMHLWEDDHAAHVDVNWDGLLNDGDEWIRECAAFAKTFGEKQMDSITTLSLMDRILFFKRVPLFAALSPSDLKQVAAIAEEALFPDGEVIAHQGEQGDAMFVIVSGDVRVCIETDGVEAEVARRTTGEYVGELAIINREPRIATLIASGDVRALCIDQKSFEGLIRERPEVSLVIIQVLTKRLKEAMAKK